MSDNDEDEKFGIQARQSHEIVARMDRQLDLVDRILAESQEDPNLANRGFTNSLGMPFVPVPGLDEVQFCIWQTRVQDYAAYAAENPGINMEWKDVELEGHRQGPDHPVVNVSWENAKAFCEWLSRKEGKNYLLPNDHEWSVAVGIGDQEGPNASPDEKDSIIDVYPWGSEWPPPASSGNFLGEESEDQILCIEGYKDPFVFTAPVGSFELEHHGIKDLSGNVWEWVEDWFSSDQNWRVLRGGSWGVNYDFALRSSRRGRDHPTARRDDRGFRVVVSG